MGALTVNLRADPKQMVTNRELVDLFAGPGAELFANEQTLRLPALPGSAIALLAWSLSQAQNASVVCITDGAQTLETAHRDLATMAPSPADEERLLYYPAWEALPGQGVEPDADITGYRFRALTQLSGTTKHPRIVVTCVQALLQKTVERERLLDATFTLELHERVDPILLFGRLAKAGYEVSHEVVTKGQVSVRGGLLDVWPLTEGWPLRVEFFGDEVESIRAFDPADQRSRERVTRAVLTPANEWDLLRDAGDRSTGELSLPHHLPPDTILVWCDEDAITDHARIYEEAVAEAGAGAFAVGYEQLSASLRDEQPLRSLSTGLSGIDRRGEALSSIRPVPGVFDLPREPLQPDVMESMRQRFVASLDQRIADGWRVAVYLDTTGSLEHFRKHVAGASRSGASASGVMHAQVGVLSEGFVCDALELVVVAEPDLYGRRKTVARRYSPKAPRARRVPAAGDRVANLSDIEVNDLVIHVDHGLGRYLGLNEIVFSGQPQEVLTIEYAEGAKLHVPTTQAHLLSRYVGMPRHAARLHRLGGRRWTKQKQAAERAIMDMASSMLETQAQRELLKGHAFAADVPWQHEFEAAFPYRETPDQETVIEAVKADMRSERPMDRLVCGDAGYGKTEVAMRAAFKAVMAGKQVAMLVPTTVLAQQHYETFRDRMSAYPVTIEMLSRFRSRGRQQSILADMARGAVDIVIGTHALLQKGVRFKDLGLVIVDEEQRFGVAHKERLKQLRRLVDVLTMTATPIPRTLYMSLTGARDMSLLQTPPRERVPIETIVTRNTDPVVREAILREVNREGQVFYLHNRVMTIDWARERLETLVPEVRVRVAHGQMRPGELSAIMHEFVAGRFDVLLCTTIIESGVDIPRANTILIDRADRFGIADLYQLRGRVGRSNHRAYAYLLTPEHGRIDADARKRIGAVRKYSGLSAGFNLALRDLEIRGAGNLLGTAQSGHITAIGFGLYCQLLQRTVARIKGDPLPPVIDVDVKLDFITLAPSDEDADNTAVIPYDYIEDERLRITTYRTIAEATEQGDIASVRESLRDRFGDIPRSVERLLMIAEIRLAAAAHGVRSVEVRHDKVMLTGPVDYLMEGTQFPRLVSDSPDRRLAELLARVETVEEWAG